MTQIINATFEGGVFKPVQPLDLPEHSQVTLTVAPLATDEEITQKLAALKAMWNNTRPHSKRLTRDQLHERR
jgi:predicted DNA-binding antitoxin AbrB/MazE fold protein